MACITEAVIGFPNASGTIPPENGTIAEIVGELGWNTYMVGKWHLCPDDEMSLARPGATGPAARGFERWYGFLGAETSQWYPDLVHDNHLVDQPRSPDEGYHLTEDLTDKASEFIRGAKAIAPEKPFVLYYAPGACHAPHHAPKSWIDKYKGRFDQGYEALREETLARQKAMSIVPPDTEVPPINPIGTSDTRTGPDGMVGAGGVVELPLGVVVEDQEPQRGLVGVTGELEHRHAAVRVPGRQKRAAPDAVPDPHRRLAPKRAVVVEDRHSLLDRTPFSPPVRSTKSTIARLAAPSRSSTTTRRSWFTLRAPARTSASPTQKRQKREKR